MKPNIKNPYKKYRIAFSVAKNCLAHGYIPDDDEIEIIIAKSKEEALQSIIDEYYGGNFTYIPEDDVEGKVLWRAAVSTIYSIDHRFWIHITEIRNLSQEVPRDLSIPI